MPPKIRLHNKHGKVKSFPSKPNPPPPVVVNQDATEPTPTTSIEDASDATKQFEVELCWCIQQLEIGLQDKKMNVKQAQESMHLLKVLKNKTQPTVRKRQLMRMHFGDYRSVMAKEEKKAKKQENVSFTKPVEKHTFIRKALFLTSDNNFKFNFQVQPQDKPNNDNNEEIKPKSESIKDVQIKPLNDVKLNFNNPEFKFNFTIE